MNCPVCKETALVMSERQGIEIDYCPQCRGVWLDRGELDKIVERAAPASVTPESRPSQPQDRDWKGQRERRDDDDRDSRRKRKKGGFLGDLFEF